MFKRAKMRSIILLLTCISTFFACQPANQSSAESTTEATETPEAEANVFGEAISEEGAISVEKMLSLLQDKDSIEVKVVGEVNAVCQAKGCWMDISSDQLASGDMKVRFKDYGFFVPKDIAGRKVIMEGYAYREVTSVDELRHYAEDAGKSKEAIAAIDEPKEELKFLASGVILLD